MSVLGRNSLASTNLDDESLINTLQNKRQSLTSEIRQNNAYHVDRRPQQKKPEAPKNSIFLATKAALEKKNVDSSYLASFDNFLRHLDGNESDESADSEKPKPKPKPKARDTNKFGQVQNLILGAPVKRTKPAPPPLSEEESFKIAVAKAKAAARARAAKEEAERDEERRENEAKTTKTARSTTAGQSLLSASKKANERIGTGRSVDSSRADTVKSASIYRTKSDAKLDSVSRDLRKSAESRSIGRRQSAAASLAKSSDAEMPKGKAKSASAGKPAQKPNQPNNSNQGQYTHQQRPKSPTYQRKAAPKPEARPFQQPAGVAADKTHHHDKLKTKTYARTTVALKPFEKPTGIGGKPLKAGKKSDTQKSTAGGAGTGEEVQAVEKDEGDEDDDDEDDDAAASKPKMTFPTKDKYRLDSDNDEEWEEIQERINNMTPTLDSILDTHPEVRRRRAVRSAPTTRSHHTLPLNWILKDESKRKRSPTPPRKRKNPNKEKSPYMHLPINFILEIKKSKKDKIRRRLLRAEREKKRAQIRALEAKQKVKQQSTSKRSLKSEGGKSLRTINESPEGKSIVGKSGLTLKEAAEIHAQKSIRIRDEKSEEEERPHHSPEPSAPPAEEEEEKAEVDHLDSEKRVDGNKAEGPTQKSQINQTGESKEAEEEDITDKRKVEFDVDSDHKDEDGADLGGQGYTTEGFTTDGSEGENKNSKKKRKRKVKKTHKARQVIRQNLSDALKTKKLHYSLVDTPYVSIPMSNIYSQQVRKRMADARERSRERREAEGYETDHRGEEETMFCPMCNHTTTDVDHALRAELRLSKQTVTRGNVTKPKFYKVKYQPKYEEDAESKLQKLIQNLEAGPGYISDGESKKRGTLRKRSKGLVPPKPSLPGQMFDDDEQDEEKEIKNILTPRREALDPPQIEPERLSIYSREGSNKSRLCTTCSSLLEIAKSDAGSMKSFADLSQIVSSQPKESEGKQEELEMPDDIATEMNTDKQKDKTSKHDTASQEPVGSASSDRLLKPKHNTTFAGLSLTSAKKSKPADHPKGNVKDMTLENLEQEDQDLEKEVYNPMQIPAPPKKKPHKFFQLKIPKSLYGVLPVSKHISRQKSKERKAAEAKSNQDKSGDHDKENKADVNEKDVDTSLEITKSDNNRGRSQVRSTYQHRSRVDRTGFSFRKPAEKTSKEKDATKKPNADAGPQPKETEIKPSETEKKPDVPKPEAQHGQPESISKTATQIKPASAQRAKVSADRFGRKTSGLSLVSRAGSCDSRSKEITPAKVEEVAKPKQDVIQVKPAGTDIKRRNVNMDRIHRDIQHTPYTTMPEMDNIYSPQFKRKMAMQNKVQEIKAQNDKLRQKQTAGKGNSKPTANSKQTAKTKQTKTAKHK